MFDGFYGMREACARCGYRFEPSQGEFTGGLMLAQGLVGLLAGAVALMLYFQGASWTAILIWLGIVAFLVPVLFYPNIKGAWLGFLFGVRGPRT